MGALSRIVLALCVAALASPTASFAAENCACIPDFQPGEFVLKVEPEVMNLPPGADELALLSQRLGVQVVDILDRELRFLLVRTPPGSSDSEMFASLNDRAGIFYAERNQLYRGATVNDPDFEYQWSLKNTGQGFCTADGRTDVRAERAWGTSKGSSSVIVAVLDSGVNGQHEDLGLRVGGWDFIKSASPPQDENGHGTQVAGIIGAVADNEIAIAGVAPETGLIHLRVLDRYNVGTLANLVKAIDYAEQRAAVVNLSLTACKRDRPLAEAIQERDAIVFVAAAGNSSRSLAVCPEYPAAFAREDGFDHLVSVMGVTCRRRRVSSSNWGADLAAPGERIVSLSHQCNDCPSSYDHGTSFAAAFVSGAAALVRSHRPGCSAPRVVRLLKDSADKSDLGGITVRHGLLDAYAALTLNGC